MKMIIIISGDIKCLHEHTTPA